MESNLVQQNNRRSGRTMKEFMKTLPRIVMLVNFIMLTICWCIMAVWKGKIKEPFTSVLASKTGYILFAMVVPWLLYIVFFIILILGCDKRFGNINWPLAFFINCGICAALLFVASCVLAVETKNSPCDAYLCYRLLVASIFAFLTSCGLIFQAHHHYHDYKARNV